MKLFVLVLRTPEGEIDLFSPHYRGYGCVGSLASVDISPGAPTVERISCQRCGADVRYASIVIARDREFFDGFVRDSISATKTVYDRLSTREYRRSYAIIAVEWDPRDPLETGLMARALE